MNLDTGIALITLAELKEYLAVGASDSTQDPILNALLNMASSWVANFLKRNLVATSYTEYYDGDASLQLMLRNVPVVSITTIWVDYLRAWANDKIVNPANYFIKKQAGIVEAFYLFGNWIPGRANVKVIYVAGYDNLGVAESAQAVNGAFGMPNAIRMAVKRIVDHHYRDGYSSRKLDISSQTRGDLMTTFRDGALQKDVEQMLLPYKQPLETPGFAYAD